ncbi:MAG: tetratricopeptide repeat protein [Proteobacteria bacterium]|nr:tetratricopeptide repeat protein [Pseudomonadota bacterium]
MRGEAALAETDPLARAVAAHRAGRIQEAEAAYRAILAAVPGHADAMHLLGLAAHQQGRHAEAAETIAAAIALHPGAAAFHSNLGTALLALGRTQEAVAACRRAVAADADFPDGWHNLGVALLTAGEMQDAEACHARAAALRPDYPEAYLGWGGALIALGREADAADRFAQAIALRPAYAEAHDSLGLALMALGRIEEAERCFRRALAEKPDLSGAASHLGIALRRQDRPDPAIACFRHAIALMPDHPEAHNNLATALVEKRALGEAEAHYRAAIGFMPDYADAHANLGMLLLTKGDFAAGWAEYEWRWRQPRRISFHGAFAEPQWRGEDAAGRTLLIHAEQGFGDTIQFCRYAPLAAARGLRVALEVQTPLVRLLRGLPGVAQVIGRGDPLPPFDLHCPMLSLPLAFGTDLGTIPASVPYLAAAPESAAEWAALLDASGRTGRRVGLVWSGNASSRQPQSSGMDRRRSIDPRLLLPLAGVPGLHLVSLQKDGPPPPEGLPVTDLMARVGDFADTAALIANLDLVVSVDTAVAHLAAALGKPVWLMDRFDACWRWLDGRRDSPWYPGLRIYRQAAPGSWHSVIEPITRGLAAGAG